MKPETAKAENDVTSLTLSGASQSLNFCLLFGALYLYK